MKLFSKRLEHPKTGKVLQIYVDGTRVQLIRFKKNVDAPAEDEVVELTTREAAMQTASRFIEAQFKKGYVDVSAPRAELELRSGESARDALARLAQSATREELAQFTERHSKELFGKLAPHWNVEFIDPRWNGGDLDAVTISLPDESEELECDALTRALLALPLAHRVRELTFGVAGYTKHGATDDWSATFSEVCAAPCAAGLVKLGFDHVSDEFVPPLDTIVIGDLSEGFDRLTSLETLSFRGQGLEWAGAELGTLTSLTWQCARFGKGDIAELLSAKLHALERLELVGEVDEDIARQLLDGLATCAPATTVKLSARKLEPATAARVTAFNARPKLRKRRRAP